MVYWQANEPSVLPRYTLSISSQIFQVLLKGTAMARFSAPCMTLSSSDGEALT